VQLQAEGEDGPIAGQVKVAKTGRIRRVSIVPADVQPPPAALEALAGADQVVLGPGSLFTSVLAALAVPALKQAVGASPGRRVYVCNLGPQEAETAGFDAAAHVEALLDHGVEIDAVLCDPRFVPTRPLPVPVHHRELADPDSRAHDPARLAGALADLLG
ncbi:MAG TPA: 2-phospho-L-lactate transferase CofD family protein, partial [Acidimicrobiales bacterium]|nr:2-phospho-L-lactate transferase CofD family protein [Acidimicrobiales bacterium]